MEDFKRILYPVALTEISPKVVPYVVTMARQLDAQVHLLHVLRRFDWFVDTYVSDPPGARLQADCQRLRKSGAGPGQTKTRCVSSKAISRTYVSATLTVVSGTHYKQIIKLCKIRKNRSHHHGHRHPLQKVMFGSVAEKVSRLATVPVMLIKST
jgi:nucleotide-binding universal stress UspA family protein